MFNKKNAVPPAQTGKSIETKSAPPLFEKTQNRPTPPAALEQAKPVTIKPDGLVTAHDQTQTQTPKDASMNQKTPNPPAPAFRPDLSRLDNPRGEASRPDLSRFDAPRRTETAPSGSARSEPATEMRKLIVGRDIALAGEISACDYLVVEGTVEARVREGRHIEIADTGLFRGTVEIDEADIAGRFEGDITVRGRLRVRSTGRIDGKVQYGELEVEAGGHLEGEVRGLKKQPQRDEATPASASKARVIAQPELQEPQQPAVAKA